MSQSRPSGQWTPGRPVAILAPARGRRSRDGAKFGAWPAWRNGRRRGLKIPRGGTPVWVRLPPPASRQHPTRGDKVRNFQGFTARQIGRNERHVARESARLRPEPSPDCYPKCYPPATRSVATRPGRSRRRMAGVARGDPGRYRGDGQVPGRSADFTALTTFGQESRGSRQTQPPVLDNTMGPNTNLLGARRQSHLHR